MNKPDNNKASKIPEGYYSTESPNPNFKKFAEKHIRENPYNPETDNYSVPAFTQPLKSSKATAIYNMHTYWSKKPHDAVREYIKHYTKPGDLVLDPMCGSGGTALASLLEKRKAIAIDRSPAATFITKNYCTPVDAVELQSAFKEYKAKVEKEISWLYETRCDRCGGKATIEYTVYSYKFQCKRCMEDVPLFDCIEIQSRTAKGKPKKIKICPHCYEKGIEEEISTLKNKRLESVPVYVSYLCENGCKPERDQRRHNDQNLNKQKFFHKYDFGKIREISKKSIPYWYPEKSFPKYFKRWNSDLKNLDIQYVYQMFTKRNLYALSVLYHFAKEKEEYSHILFALNSILNALSRMQGFSHDKRFPNQLLRGTYYIPPVGKEYNAIHWITGKIANLTSGYKKIKNQINLNDLIISIGNAFNLSCINSDIIDYIFTDPPYSDNVQYGELNFMWEAWLDLDTNWHAEEIIVNKTRGKSKEDWANMMHQAMAECYRVLKPGRWISLCYHDKAEGSWALLQNIMSETGFIPDKSDSALYIDAGQKSYNQIVADKVTKRDLVINFRKPYPGELPSGIAITGNEDLSTFAEKVHSIIKDYLNNNPGSTKDHIYDEVVSRMVRKGQMEAHNFDDLLLQIAEEVKSPVKKNLAASREVSIWYLKENENQELDKAELKIEDEAAKSIADYMKNQLTENPEKTGVHYSDIFEHYIYSVQNKPKRQLADFLLDYFFKTDKGTYRLPETDEEELIKKQGRKGDLSRSIRRYISLLTNGAIPAQDNQPDSLTISGWIRHCKRTSMFEHGKYLFEHGGLNLEKLSEEDQAYVEEDYLTCVKMLGK